MLLVRVKIDGSWGHESWRWMDTNHGEIVRVKIDGSWGHEPWRWTRTMAMYLQYSATF